MMEKKTCAKCGKNAPEFGNEIQLVCECGGISFIVGDREPVWKIYDARNQLIFVTVSLKRTKEYITEQFGVVFSSDSTINYSRLIYGVCRVEKEYQPTFD